MPRERTLARLCWAAGRTGLTVAAVLVVVGGVLAATASRPSSDAAVLAAFALVLCSLPLCLLGLAAATTAPDPLEQELS